MVIGYQILSILFIVIFYCLVLVVIFHLGNFLSQTIKPFRYPPKYLYKHLFLFSVVPSVLIFCVLLWFRYFISDDSNYSDIVNKAKTLGLRGPWDEIIFQITVVIHIIMVAPFLWILIRFSKHRFISFFKQSSNEPHLKSEIWKLSTIILLIGSILVLLFVEILSVILPSIRKLTPEYSFYMFHILILIALTLIGLNTQKQSVIKRRGLTLDGDIVESCVWR